MSFTPLLGYPTKFGNKNVEVIDFTGPDYSLLGGEPFPASNFGWGAFDIGIGGVSQSGLYRAEVGFQGDGAQQTAYIVFFELYSGTEVANGTDLSSEVFRLGFIGV